MARMYKIIYQSKKQIHNVQKLGHFLTYGGKCRGEDLGDCQGN